MKSKRLFIGLVFSDKFATALEPWVKKIKKSADRKDVSLKWTPAANYHTTLVFLGDTNEEQIPTIEEKIKLVASRHKNFKLKIREISGFPTISQARVIYLSVQRSQAILDLQSDLEKEILPPEKVEPDYVPHLTIARLRNPKTIRDLISPFQHIDLGKQDVTSIRLFSSVLANGYPIYELISKFDLLNDEH